MSKRNNENHKSGLAAAIAAGTKVAKWARENQVPARTARHWSRSPEIVGMVEQIRRGALDRAIGRLSRNATAAANEIARLARKAESESVRLQAARAVLSELMAVSDYAVLAARLAEVEKQLRDSSRSQDPGSEPDPSGDREVDRPDS